MKTTDDLLIAFDEWRELKWELDEGLYGTTSVKVNNARADFACLLNEIIDNRVKAILSDNRESS